MIDDEEARLLAKLASIEALHAGATSDGERSAAAAACDRIRTRLHGIEKTDPPVEYRFSLPDPWQRKLFCALARRYGLAPYRERGQRRTTIMLRVPKRFLDTTLWPEYRELSAALQSHLDAVTQRLIAKAVHEDASEGEEAPLRLAGTTAPETAAP